MRKGYAVFNSIGRQVKIGVLAFSMSLVTMSTQQAAAQDTSNTATARESESEAVPIDEVVVAATQKTLATVEPARVTTVISRKEIALLPVQDLSQLLEYVAGVDLRQRGASGTQADIGIRGGTYDQSLILLNGINLTDPQTGHHNLNLPVDLESIDRVEILQGPGSRAMGPHAFSGIINIVTGSATQSQVQAKAEGGSYGYSGFGTSATEVLKKWTFFASASQKKSDGHTHNTDFDMLDLFAQARYADSATGQWNLQLGRQQKSFGANGFYSPSYPDQYETTRTHLAALDFAKDIGIFSISAAAYYRQHFDKYELIKNSPSGRNHHRTDVAGGQLRAHFFSPFGKTIVGGELRGEHIYSTNLGDNMGKPKPIRSEDDSLFYAKEKLRKIVSWYAEQVYYHQNFSVSGGLQGSYSNSFGHYLCANADVAYSLSSAWQLNLSAGSSLRLPTFTDLFYESPVYSGNRDLKPEQATTYEVGAKYALPNLTVQSSVFYRVGKNIIDRVLTGVRNDNTKLWQSRNHISLNTLGATFSGAYAPQNGLKHFLSSVKLDYTYLKMFLNENNMETTRVLDHLKYKAVLTCVHDLPYKLGFSWSLIHEQRNGQYVDAGSGLSDDFSPVTLVDAKLFWSYKHFQLYVEASNLFDHRYFDFANLQQAGRWIKGGVQVKI